MRTHRTMSSIGRALGAGSILTVTSSARAELSPFGSGIVVRAWNGDDFTGGGGIGIGTVQHDPAAGSAVLRRRAARVDNDDRPGGR